MLYIITTENKDIKLQTKDLQEALLLLLEDKEGRILELWDNDIVIHSFWLKKASVTVNDCYVNTDEKDYQLIRSSKVLETQYTVKQKEAIDEIVRGLTHALFYNS